MLLLSKSKTFFVATQPHLVAVWQMWQLWDNSVTLVMLLPLILCWDNPHRWMSMSVDKGQPLWIQLWHRCLSREKTKMTYNSAEVFYLCRVVYQPQYYRIPFWYSACPQLSPPQIFRKMDNRYFSHRPKDTLELPFHWKNDAGRPRLRAANGCLKEGTQTTFYGLTKNYKFQTSRLRKLLPVTRDPRLWRRDRISKYKP